MESVVIVALPNVDDRVHEISSEPVAHMTLLYLDKATVMGNLENVLKFVQHAAKTQDAFWISVDRRGTLGEDQADVLFFDKKRVLKHDVGNFRSNLLKNDTIKIAFDKADQFPDWTPHLTLGYPEAPAKELRDGERIYNVEFDRIAVWVDEYGGPEFLLNREDLESDGMSSHFYMSDEQEAVTGAILDQMDDIVHYGVKGMKWGVRRAENSQRIANNLQSHADKAAARAEKKSIVQPYRKYQAAIAQARATRQQMYATKLQKKVDAKTAAKLDKKQAKDNAESTRKAHEAWKKDASGTEMANKVFQKAAKDFEKTAEIINNDANYKGKDVSKGLLGKQYRATMNHYFNEHLAQASVDLTLNDQGRAYIYTFDPGSGMMRGKEYKMQHSTMAEGFSLPDYRVEMDSLGHFTSFHLDAEIKHYGVKGMQWGVTRSPAQLAAARNVKIKAKDGNFVKTKGGKKLPASQDAVNAAVSRQKAKQSTTDSLSNSELQQLVNRMNLEQQYKRLSTESDRRSRGSKFLAGLFGQKQYENGKRKVSLYDEFEDAGEMTRTAAQLLKKQLNDKANA